MSGCNIWIMDEKGCENVCFELLDFLMVIISLLLYFDGFRLLMMKVSGGIVVL